MKLLGRLVSWAVVAVAVTAAMAFSSVQGPRTVMVDAVQPAHIVSTGSIAGAKAVRAALTRLGDPYSWAAAGPHAFDCSGLVVWAFEQGGVSLPHSSQALSDGGQPVAPDRIQPGDVITYYSDASHVGLYIGGGKIVHASTYGVPVAVVPVDNAPIHNVRRYR